MTLSEEIKEQKIKKYKKQIYRLLQSCYRFFQGSPMNIQLIDQYMKVYRPLANHIDLTGLPFKSKGKLAIKKKKVHCFFAMLNYVVIQFWQFCGEQDNEPALMEAIIEAKDVVDKGLDKYKIAGTDKEGYHLVE